jgi:predicted fused transcriptional regulator/phosphomethylpyrimidine kinase
MHGSYGKIRVKGSLDASPLQDNYMVSAAPAVGLPTETLPFFSLSYALGNLLASFAVPEFVTDVITLPPENCNIAGKIYRNLEEMAERFDVKIAGGHTGCYEGVELPLISVTAFGKKLRNPMAPANGDSILLVGEPLMESRWLRWLAGLSEASVEWMELTPVHALRDMLKMQEVKLAHDVSEGGIGGALIEIQERFGLNVSLKNSKLADELSDPSYGTALAVTDNTGEVCKKLERLGHRCQVIAEIGGKEPLVSVKRSNTWDIYGKPASTFDRTMNRFSLFLKYLSGIDFRALVPEVGINIAYSDGAASPENIMGIDGRITKGLDGVKIGNPKYGASKHVGYILYEVQRLGAGYRVAANVKLSDATITALKKMNMKVQVVDDTGDQYCPPLKLIRETKKIADAYVEMPSRGMEGGIVLLTESLEKMLDLIKNLCL